MECKSSLFSIIVPKSKLTLNPSELTRLTNAVASSVVLIKFVLYILGFASIDKTV